MLAPSQAATAVDDRPPPPPLSACNSLFLDFDGTLVDLADRPDGVIVDPDLAPLLTCLHDGLQGRVAIVSGRSIGQLDDLLGPITTTIALAGSHGAERRTRSEGHVRPLAARSLEAATQHIQAFAAGHSGVIVETKSHGVALHYRLAPQFGEAIDTLAARIAADHGLIFQPGKMMAEVRVAGDKGAAVHALMQLPDFAGSTPVFCGDDVTDEEGFIEARAFGGGGVLVGDARPTAALWRVANTTLLRDWLVAATKAMR